MTHTVLVGGACHERKTGIVLRDKYLMGSDGGTSFRRYSHPLSYQQHFLIAPSSLYPISYRISTLPFTLYPTRASARRSVANSSGSGRSGTNQEMTSLSPPPQSSLPSSLSLAMQLHVFFR